MVARVLPDQRLVGSTAHVALIGRGLRNETENVQGYKLLSCTNRGLAAA
jgi:hypothetical protein